MATGFRKELFWTRIILYIIFLGAIVCDDYIHHDYEAMDREIEQLRASNHAYYVYLVALNQRIMPACFKGQPRRRAK